MKLEKLNIFCDLIGNMIISVISVVFTFHICNKQYTPVFIIKHVYKNIYN